VILAGLHPVVLLPDDAEVLDLSGAPPPSPRWSIGRYDEVRGIYTQARFAGGRCVHMGVDLGGPAGVAVHAFADGVVRFAEVIAGDGDYGPTLVTEHRLEGAPLWVLHGHLSPASLRHSPPGRRLAAGDVIGWLGTEADNGGWPPHVHVQVSRQPPDGADWPGVVTLAERDAARRRYPDPRCILGPIYR